MAVDNLKHEWHLTSEGWISGSLMFFDNLQGKKIERPINAIETWIDQTYQKSNYSSEEQNWYIMWKNESIPEKTRDLIRAKFPKPVNYD